jgi:succinate-semialdehyde dehydrogenase/glutarate-semialdehyde dehydrogenase
MYERYGLFIDGRWQGAADGGTAPVLSPVTEKPLGGRARDFNVGHFHEPTVLADVTDDMRVFAEETFGPVAAVTRFRDEDEVIERANATDMGLSAYAFTRSPERARRTVAGLKAGMIGINSFALAASEAPFGGTKFSGLGREGGAEGIGDYLETKLAQVVF